MALPEAAGPDQSRPAVRPPRRPVGGPALVLVGAGVGFGVLNVAVFELLEHLAPADAVVEAFTWVTTAGGAGVAGGAAAAGALSRYGAPDMLLLVVVAPALAAVLAGIRRTTLRSPQPPREQRQ